jgi:hypothetical protein
MTARSVTTSRWAMAALERPSAITASTSRSRGLSRASGQELVFGDDDAHGSAASAGGG